MHPVVIEWTVRRSAYAGTTEDFSEAGLYLVFISFVTFFKPLEMAAP